MNASSDFPPEASGQNRVAPSPESKVPPLDLTSPPARSLNRTPNANAYSTIERWVNRLAMILFVSLCAIFGVLLVILPWTPKWTDNYIMISYPGLRDFLENAFVRGMCTGLGALDIWIGFSEATHYHEAEDQV
jgi:hypothetical protein